MTQQRFEGILQNFHFANNEDDDKSDKGQVLNVMFWNIHDVTSSKLTPLVDKMSHGKNLHFRYSSVNIFQTCHRMT